TRRRARAASPRTPPRHLLVYDVAGVLAPLKLRDQLASVPQQADAISDVGGIAGVSRLLDHRLQRPLLAVDDREHPRVAAPPPPPPPAARAPPPLSGRGPLVGAPPTPPRQSATPACVAA